MFACSSEAFLMKWKKNVSLLNTGLPHRNSLPEGKVNKLPNSTRTREIQTQTHNSHISFSSRLARNQFEKDKMWSLWLW